MSDLFEGPEALRSELGLRLGYVDCRSPQQLVRQLSVARLNRIRGALPKALTTV